MAALEVPRLLVGRRLAQELDAELEHALEVAQERVVVGAQRRCCWPSAALCTLPAVSASSSSLPATRPRSPSSSRSPSRSPSAQTSFRAHGHAVKVEVQCTYVRSSVRWRAGSAPACARVARAGVAGRRGHVVGLLRRRDAFVAGRTCTDYGDTCGQKSKRSGDCQSCRSRRARLNEVPTYENVVLLVAQSTICSTVNQ